jgi:phage N-6-adenine-methyltransferase
LITESLSKTNKFETPQNLFNELNDEFGFTLDVCASPNNTKCRRFFTPEMNGLIQSWAGETCWMNPPYGREISSWVEKAYKASINEAATVVCLVPSRTDTRWWHEYCMRGEIRFIRGRLRFGESNSSAFCPNAIVIFRRIVANRHYPI